MLREILGVVHSREARCDKWETFALPPSAARRTVKGVKPEVEAWLTQGGSVDARYEGNRTLLMVAAERGRDKPGGY